MINQSLKNLVVDRILPRVQTPAQYVGGEWNSVVKDHRGLRGKLCLAFPDAYSIGMSCHAMQVLYDIMNRRDGWVCERAFAPLEDMERLLRENRLPLWSLETFTPLARFDVLGFTLQYDLCYTNVLTMLDLGGVPLEAERRTLDQPLVVAGGPCASNPEPMARFFDLFVVGDGEESLPEVCELWVKLKRSGRDRESLLAETAARLPYVYAPRFYRPEYGGDGRATTPRPLRDELPALIAPAVVEDLDAFAPPAAPVVPFVECVHDRIAVEIMRGCPGRCRFCQSTTIKRPLRFRSIENVVQAAMEQYRNTGYNEISLLSLSSSDYPDFDVLVGRLHEIFRPLHVGVSLPSLRVTEQLRVVGEVLNTDRHSSLTLAPEVARDEMRRRIGKPIANEDLMAGCRRAFERGFSRVKLYFMCGLPGERERDLDGIVEMSESISRLGKEVRGRPVEIVASVSNFIPKPQTPFQWNAMRRREYFRWAHEYLRRRKRLRSVRLRCHEVEASLLEGVLCRGDRRAGEAVELAWRRGARFDAWTEKLKHELWRQALDDAGIDVERTLHAPYAADAQLPWDHVGIRQGRAYLERERQLAADRQAAGY
ncbi:MAG: TIGR03960 family B12-binding radical SAM protein [Pirellulales bacterium]|nr:TIGR03960 family B12-binding radical SAM protein [Pirellulales bacterium]